MHFMCLSPSPSPPPQSNHNRTRTTMHPHWQSHYFPARTTTSNLLGSATRAIDLAAGRIIDRTAYITRRINDIPEDDPTPILNMLRQSRINPTWTTDYAALAHEIRSEIELAEKSLGRAKCERRYGRDVCEDDDIRPQLGVAERELYAIKAQYECLESEATRLQGVRGTRPDDA
jgi:hypothetical protein